MFYFRDTILPLNREVRASFQNMPGIGYWKSFLICSKIGLAHPFFISNLTDYLFLLSCFFFKDFSTLSSHIEREFFDELTR
jgi:ribosomal protein S13